jgi:hypothetical protein
MSQPNLAAMAAVAGRLDGMGLEYAFLGGSIVNLLLDHPGLSPARPTDVSPVAFLATKYVAFLERGRRDYYASHDLEDLITVIDGREEIVQEVQDAPGELRTYVIGAIRELLAVPTFAESLPGHLPSDRANQQRLPSLRRKLNAIAELRLTT